MLAFSIPSRGQFTWSVRPQGLKTAPSSFQRFMDFILQGIPQAKAYQDDIFIGATSMEELLSLRAQVLTRLSDYTLKINADKMSTGKQR